MNKNLEHCSLSKVKQFDSGLILGENRKSREKYIEKMSEKVKKWSKKWSEIFGSIWDLSTFGWMTVVEKWYDSKNSENRLESSFHSKNGKREIRKKFRNYERSKEEWGIMENHLVIYAVTFEPQVTSLGHDLSWRTHTLCRLTYHDQNWTKTPVHHGPTLRLENFFLPPKTYLYCSWTITASYSRGSILPVRGLPVPYGPYELNFRMRKWLIYHCHPRKSALIIFPITRP